MYKIINLLFIDINKCLYLWNTDINECDRRFGPSGQCGEGASCTNTLGSFTCTCPPGYSGNGRVKCQGNILRNITKIADIASLL